MVCLPRQSFLCALTEDGKLRGKCRKWKSSRCMQGTHCLERIKMWVGEAKSLHGKYFIARVGSFCSLRKQLYQGTTFIFFNFPRETVTEDTAWNNFTAQVMQSVSTAVSCCPCRVWRPKHSHIFLQIPYPSAQWLICLPTPHPPATLTQETTDSPLPPQRKMENVSFHLCGWSWKKKQDDLCWLNVSMNAEPLPHRSAL